MRGAISHTVRREVGEKCAILHTMRREVREKYDVTHNVRSWSDVAI